MNEINNLAVAVLIVVIGFSIDIILLAVVVAILEERIEELEKRIK